MPVPVLDDRQPHPVKGLVHAVFGVSSKKCHLHPIQAGIDPSGDAFFHGVHGEGVRHDLGQIAKVVVRGFEPGSYGWTRVAQEAEPGCGPTFLHRMRRRYLGRSWVGMRSVKSENIS